MLHDIKYYHCPICGNLLETVRDSGQVPVCCGKEMTLLRPGTTDGVSEKHLPMVTIKHSTVMVNVGAIPHPMTMDHHIEWIAILTNMGYQRLHLQPGEEAEAIFHINCDEKLLAVFAYCNLHGLWRTSIT